MTELEDLQPGFDPAYNREVGGRLQLGFEFCGDTRSSYKSLSGVVSGVVQGPTHL